MRTAIPICITICTDTAHTCILRSRSRTFSFVWTRSPQREQQPRIQQKNHTNTQGLIHEPPFTPPPPPTNAEVVRHWSSLSLSHCNCHSLRHSHRSYAHRLEPQNHNKNHLRDRASCCSRRSLCYNIKTGAVATKTSAATDEDEDDTDNDNKLAAVRCSSSSNKDNNKNQRSLRCKAIINRKTYF